MPLEKSRTLLPSYRPAPDYETAVQQKYHAAARPSNNIGVHPGHQVGPAAILYSSQPEVRSCVECIVPACCVLRGTQTDCGRCWATVTEPELVWPLSASARGRGDPTPARACQQWATAACCYPFSAQL
ncbi:hypothetical protein PR048_009338 [Dryococelus australis]|uniref:Uncharacterized protein n=1 Tax=Dryococelus australis TaxID=614101 RepID=A0ABQ9HZQ8_9NEOP|nr:hypothetical protein PR048_009338 [Dryococelus australis]